jgi:hypothetical protein
MLNSKHSTLGLLQDKEQDIKESSQCTELMARWEGEGIASIRQYGPEFNLGIRAYSRTAIYIKWLDKRRRSRPALIICVRSPFDPPWIMFNNLEIYL